MQITSQELIKVNIAILFRYMWQPVWVIFIFSEHYQCQNTSLDQSLASSVVNSGLSLDSEG